MTDVFISSSSSDKEIAGRTATQLEMHGYSVFLDYDVLVPGGDFSEKITNELKHAHVVIVFLSKNTQRSSWVQDELAFALEQGRPERVIPILLDVEAKNNWVWPLVADRQSIELFNVEDGLSNVLGQVMLLLTPPSYFAKGFVLSSEDPMTEKAHDTETLSTLSISAPKSSSSLSWLIKIFKVGAFLVGAFLVGAFLLILSYPSDMETIQNNSDGEQMGQYEDWAEHQKAIDYYEQALTSNLNTYGEDHPRIAIDRDNLGNAWASLGEYQKAIDYYELALASDLKTYGEDHPHVARDRSNLGNAWASLGEYQKAIDYYEQALVTIEKMLEDAKSKMADSATE